MKSYLKYLALDRKRIFFPLFLVFLLYVLNSTPYDPFDAYCSKGAYFIIVWCCNIALGTGIVGIIGQTYFEWRILEQNNDK